MKIKRYEDIEAWQPVESVKVERLARELTRNVYCLKESRICEVLWAKETDTARMAISALIKPDNRKE